MTVTPATVVPFRTKEGWTEMLSVRFANVTSTTLVSTSALRLCKSLEAANSEEDVDAGVT